MRDIVLLNLWPQCEAIDLVAQRCQKCWTRNNVQHVAKGMF